MRNNFVLLLILFVVSSKFSIGQEMLLDLQTMPLKKEVKPNISPLRIKANSSLILPFFDDFAKGLSYPDPDNWTNSYVFINQTYPINPVTVGVATFDAIDQNGKLYSHLTTSSLPSDTLTSRPIYLDTVSNVFLSFYYEPKGLGKEPSATDSLVVEFLSKDENKWLRAWSVSPHFNTNSVIENYHLEGNIVTKKATKISENFFRVMIPIYDERFLTDSFQFRFINYASLPANLQVPSLRGNGDQWHIDYVYLNKDRFAEDTIPDDVAFCQPMKSILKNFEAIPWKHFNSGARQVEFTDPLSLKIHFRNLSNSQRNVFHRFVFTDFSNSLRNDSSYYFSFDYKPYTTCDSTIFYEYTYNSDWSDSAKFSIESYLKNLDDSLKQYLKWNDTIRYTQKFLNYYAYDDGTAENGYGLYGNGSDYGMVALKYTPYLADSLKGVMIYFNRSLQDNNLLYIPDSVEFHLTVWDDDNGKPGTILYQCENVKPKFTDRLNKFAYYPIKSKLKINGTFWVGWVNTTTDFLNVGFDCNNVHNDKLYYNLNGTWEQSQFTGSLMIRPIFGYVAQYQTGIITPTKKTSFSIFPNPASSSVNLNLPEGVTPERVRVFNLAGQLVISKTYDSSSIDVSNLSAGIYLFQLTFQNKPASTQKLVIIK